MRIVVAFLGDWNQMERCLHLHMLLKPAGKVGEEAAGKKEGEKVFAVSELARCFSHAESVRPDKVRAEMQFDPWKSIDERDQPQPVSHGPHGRPQGRLR